MRLCTIASNILATLALITASQLACAANFPEPKDGDFIVSDFRFHTGETVPQLKMHYVTIGAPTGEPVVIMHGTAQSSAAMLTPGFAGELFGPGQPLDANRYYIILPDVIGAGKSSKPSDGLRARFPHYNYDDLVNAQYRLVTEHLGIKHLRMLLGYSMGGMETWMWAQQHPEFMDVAVPMASLPSEMSGRNWMMRRLIIDTIHNDPEWMGGNYTKQPRATQFAAVFFGISTAGGSQAFQKAAPTRALADALLNQRLAAPFTADTNDYLYQWESSGDYNPSAGLEKIRAVVLAINSADDERNPPELGILERELKRIKNASAYIIPGSPTTSGHGTGLQAALWKKQLADVLQSAPRLSN